MLVSDTQFSTSSCSNIPVEPKHIRYALYDWALNAAGASESTANQDSTSVSFFSLMGCHTRIEMNGKTCSPPSSTFGQLCTKLMFGKTCRGRNHEPVGAHELLLLLSPGRFGTTDHLRRIADIAHPLLEIPPSGSL